MVKSTIDYCRLNNLALVSLLAGTPRIAIASRARRVCILRRWAGARTDRSSAVLAR